MKNLTDQLLESLKNPETALQIDAIISANSQYRLIKTGTIPEAECQTSLEYFRNRTLELEQQLVDDKVEGMTRPPVVMAFANEYQGTVTALIQERTALKYALIKIEQLKKQLKHETQ